MSLIGSRSRVCIQEIKCRGALTLEIPQKRDSELYKPTRHSSTHPSIAMLLVKKVKGTALSNWLREEERRLTSARSLNASALWSCLCTGSSPNLGTFQPQGLVA